MKFCDNLHGGLNKLAETLDVVRIGPQHQVRKHWQLCRMPATGSWLLLGVLLAFVRWRPISQLPFSSNSGLQAGSDSLLTSAAFLKLAEQRFQGMDGVAQHRGILYGLGDDGRTNMLGAED